MDLLSDALWSSPGGILLQLSGHFSIPRHGCRGRQEGLSRWALSALISGSHPAQAAEPIQPPAAPSPDREGTGKAAGLLLEGAAVGE